ncbi:MAG: hypothetical protein E7466_07850 [Ruminococcaceae bacterium]|nr:hypothetical protein [Oscillospiraceae bacterium]
MLLRGIVMAAMLLGAIVGLPLGIFESADWLWAYPLLALGFFVLELVLAFVYLLIVCKGVDMDAEQEIDDPRYRKIVELYADSIIPMVRVNIITKGLNKVPKEGRFLLVCNHCSNADPVVLLRELSGHQVAFISKKENRDMFVIGPMMHKILCQMIDRENDREALKTILKCIRILKEDKASIGVFPEGGIHKSKKLQHFRPGVFKIAQKAEVPIVVCTLKNTKNVIPNMAKLRHTDVELSVLEVIPAEELKGVTTTDIADRAYRLMAADLGPENVAEE